MHTRILLPNRASDPRWGYLDKFDVNPYLARAFALSVMAAMAAVALSRGWPRPDAALVADRAPFGIAPEPPPVAWLLPVPAAGGGVRFLGRPRVAAARWNPVPAPVEPTAPDVAGDAATMSADAEVTTLGDPAATAQLGNEPRPWPAPDDFIPAEHEPILVAIPVPVYPEIARAAGLEGTVLVRVLVGEDGFVHRLLVAQSVLGLDDAALAAARDAVFRPALQQDRPVAVWVVVPIEFRLRD